MSNNNIIGERIKELREQAKEKQWGLAKKINVSPVEVCRYEKNERKPSVRAIIAISKHYNVSADYILGLTDTVKVMPSKTGHWFDVGSLSCRCSCCGCKSKQESRFCPNCGAKMKGETE